MKTKIKHVVNMPRVLAFLGLGVLIFLSRVGVIGAQTLTQGFSSDKPLERGIIVRLSAKDTTKVEPLKASEAEAMHGVVVAANDSPITLSDDTGKTFVATSGRFDVLVSTQNGEVKAGDYITISSTEGIGMKASDSSRFVIGKAVSGFDGSTSVTGEAQINGKTVHYGRVFAEIGVAANPLFKSPATGIPRFLEQAAQAVGGQQVSTIRLYTASIVALATMLITGSILYAGIRSSIISVGRNPLAKAAVGKGMLRVLFIGLIVFISGVFAVYLLVKL